MINKLKELLTSTPVASSYDRGNELTSRNIDVRSQRKIYPEIILKSPEGFES